MLSLEITPARRKFSVLNGLLRGELAAIESYRLALSKDEIQTQSNAISLKRIQKEHRASAQALGHLIHERGGIPESSPGPWGVCAKAVTMTAQFFGKIVLLNALREGEEMGLKTYLQILRQPRSLDPQVKELIEQTLIPMTESHIRLLTRILEMEISNAFEN